MGMNPMKDDSSAETENSLFGGICNEDFANQAKQAKQLGYIMPNRSQE